MLIRDKEQSLQDGLLPQSANDFERMLVGDPNSSYLWVQYMAHYLMNIDIDAARKVAERALRVINFREEDEKYNVWVALINLEHKFGNDSSLESVFTRATTESKGKYLFMNLADVYEKSGDFSNAEKTLEKALKKFKKSKKVSKEKNCIQ